MLTDGDRKVNPIWRYFVKHHDDTSMRCLRCSYTTTYVLHSIRGVVARNAIYHLRTKHEDIYGKFEIERDAWKRHQRFFGLI